MNEGRPLVTVAMVTYNSGLYVSDAIESVLSQSYSSLELVVCDDASSDNSWAMISRYDDPRVRRYRNSTNVGEYQNRNIALHHARGDYLIYIDGDDILYPHGLEFMVRSLDEFPQCGMALARPWNENIIYPLELTPREFFVEEFLGRGTAGINFTQILFRTAALHAAGAFPTTARQGDLLIQYRIAATHNVLLVSDGLAWWRRRAGQASEQVLRSHLGWVESLDLRREALLERASPLTRVECATAIASYVGSFLRMAVRYLAAGRLFHAWTLFRCSRIRLAELRFALRSPSRAGLFTDGKVRSSGVARNPFYRKHESTTTRGES